MKHIYEQERKIRKNSKEDYQNKETQWEDFPIPSSYWDDASFRNWISFTIFGYSPRLQIFENSDGSYKISEFSNNKKISELNIAAKINSNSTIYIYSRLNKNDKWLFEFSLACNNELFDLGFDPQRRLSELFHNKIINNYFFFPKYHFDLELENFETNLRRVSPKSRLRWYKSLQKKNPSKRKK